MSNNVLVDSFVVVFEYNNMIDINERYYLSLKLYSICIGKNCPVLTAHNMVIFAFPATSNR